jgi:hypothetical protein
MVSEHLIDPELKLPSNYSQHWNRLTTVCSNYGG